MTRYAVIGLGAVGGLYGTRLVEAGHEVHFLVKSDAELIRSNGIHLTSVDGDATIESPSVFQDASDLPPVDAVVVALKTTANNALEAILPPLLDGAEAVVLLQNGLGVEDRVSGICGEKIAVLGGLCFVCSHKESPGCINHIDYGPVTVGEWTPDGSPAGITPWVDRFASDLSDGGVKVNTTQDLAVARWKKLCWNIPYNGLSVVLDKGTDLINSNPHTRELVAQIMDEVRRGCLAINGRTFDEDFIAKMLTDTDAMKPYDPSMKLDYDAGRELELEAIYRSPLVAAANHGYDMIRAKMLLAQLEIA